MNNILIDLCGQRLVPVYSIIGISPVYFKMGSVGIFSDLDSRHYFEKTEEGYKKHLYIETHREDNLSRFYCNASIDVFITGGDNVTITTDNLDLITKGDNRANEIFEVREKLVKYWEECIKNINIVKL